MPREPAMHSRHLEKMAAAGSRAAQFRRSPRCRRLILSGYCRSFRSRDPCPPLPLYSLKNKAGVDVGSRYGAVPISAADLAVCCS